MKLKDKLSIALILVTILAGCKNKQKNFSDFVEVQKIEKVIMINNSGEFTLSNKQLAKYKKQISSMTYFASGDIIKTGAISMTLYIDNKKYYMEGRTNGDLVLVDNKLITKNKLGVKGYIFKVNGINFDNFKKNQ